SALDRGRQHPARLAQHSRALGSTSARSNLHRATTELGEGSSAAARGRHYSQRETRPPSRSSTGRSTSTGDDGTRKLPASYPSGTFEYAAASKSRSRDQHGSVEQHGSAQHESERVTARVELASDDGFAASQLSAG